MLLGTTNWRPPCYCQDASGVDCAGATSGSCLSAILWRALSLRMTELFLICPLGRRPIDKDLGKYWLHHAQQSSDIPGPFRKPTGLTANVGICFCKAAVDCMNIGNKAIGYYIRRNLYKVVYFQRLEARRQYCFCSHGLFVLCCLVDTSVDHISPSRLALM